MNLDYSGDFLQYRYQIPTQNPFPEPPTHEYLTFGCGGMPASSINWHCGFFDSSGHPENKYFMLVNLYQNADEKQIKVCVTEPVGSYDYANYRFRNIEGIFDTTFNVEIEKSLTHIKGEGYLYQVAPVIRYGGRLLNNEATVNGMSLEDDMVIENGKTLTINGVYNSNANITVKNGSIVIGENGTIHFAAGKKLFVDGPCTIAGNSESKLKLIFTPSQNDEITGITINPGGSLTINNCQIENANIGIQSLVNAQYLKAEYVDFINCGTHSINIIGFSGPEQPLTPAPSIKYCNINNSEHGISVTNLSQIVIQENTISNTGYGIYMANVSTPAIVGNHLTGTKQEPGIFLGSCNGVVRGNIITNHTNGLHLANSSPDIGGNLIYDNWNRGIYVGVGSLPNMEGKLVMQPPLYYAVSGYNKIYNNGGWTEEDDGSEIFINEANVRLKGGCNEITDQRIPDIEATPPLRHTQFLMNCRRTEGIIAPENFWDVHPIYHLEDRFGDCDIDYEPFLEQPCSQPDGSGGKLPITSKTGEVIDTLYADQRTISTLTETEEQYAIAEENFLTGNLSGAMQIYEAIIAGNATEEEKHFAYQRKYEIGRLTDQQPEFFNTLGNTYLTLAANAQDSVTIKLFTQLSILCKVSEEEYLESINQFDGIVQQNPNTEEAIYAEIDALTTALLIEESDSTLQKGRLGKYLVKNSNDYSTKVDEILKKQFGSGAIEKEEEVLPTEFTLYQNYPNPFNPATVIKYDLAGVSDVSLIIYDILGRKVKELVNTKQEAGRYEVQFNATSLASGVYIYQLAADNPSTSSGQRYISSRKMILLK